MHALWRDLRFAIRTWTRKPGFLAAAVVTLGVGIGLNVTVFALVDGLAFEPLPVERPETLVSIYGTIPSEATPGPLSTADFERVRDEIDAFEQVVATTYTPLAVESSGRHRLVLGERVGETYFDLLGVVPRLGRAFAVGEADAAVAVLSHAAWRRHYGGDADIVGRTIRVGGQQTTVLGVAPAGFHGLLHGITPELWLPMRPALGESASTTEASEPTADQGWLWVTGRLANGHSVGQAASAVDALSQRLRRESPAARGPLELTAVARRQVRVLPGLDGALVTVSWIALGGVLLVLSIACANVANLLLARAAGRRREMATRRSLGADASAIVRQLLTESLVLAALGGSVGWLLALAANAVLEGVAWPIPVDFVWGRPLDPQILLFVIGASVGCAVAVGVLPALDAARSDVIGGLRDRGGGRRQRRWSQALVVAQIAISSMLLVSAGLATRSLHAAGRIDLGFEPDGVVVASLAPRQTAQPVDEVYRRLMPRIRAIPGVESAGLASHLPLTLERRFERVAVAGQADDGAPWPRIDTAIVGPGALETLRVPLVDGRLFDRQDRADSEPVAVVNESFARRFWPGGSALDRRVRREGSAEELRVVGVVADGKYRGLGEAPRPFLYTTFEQGHWHRVGHGGEITTGTETLVLRVHGDTGAVLAAVRQAIADLDPEIPISRLGPMHLAIAPAIAPTRIAAWLFGAFGLLGLFVASVGLYAVMAQGASRRMRELGIRMALGARPGQIVMLVARDGLLATAIGLTVGLAGAAVAGRAASSLLFGIESGDLVVRAGVVAVLGAVVVLAGLTTARRALRDDPQASLRQDG